MNCQRFSVSPRVLFFCCLAPLASCAEGKAGEQEPISVRDSAGIHIVENHGVDQSLPVRLSFLADLLPPDSIISPLPWGIAADSRRGRIYVADRLGKRIVMFDADGNYIGTMGRPGKGPGEFENPAAVALDPHGAVAVWDPGRGIISRWSSVGNLLNEERPPLSYWGPGFAVGSNAEIVTVTASPSQDGTSLVQKLVVHTPGSGSLAVHEIAVGQHEIQLPCMAMVGSKILAPDMIWTSAGDTAFVSVGPGYRFDAIVGSSNVLSVRRDTGPLRVTEEMAAATVERGPSPYGALMRQCNADPQAMVRAIGYEEQVSPIFYLATDLQNGIWASRTRDAAGPAFIDVFDNTGRYEGSLNASMTAPGIPVTFVADSVVVTLRRSDLDVIAASLYRVVSSGPSDAKGSSGRSTGGHLDAVTFKDCPVCPEMVVVPGGSFRMGNLPDEAVVANVPERYHDVLSSDTPQVAVAVDSFALGRYEVTFAEWDACVEDGGCSYVPDDEGMGRGAHPVINVTRRDALAYIQWLSSASGREYRLPSEAEWEYAARAGTQTARYWGNEPREGTAVCDGCGSKWDKRSTAPVGSLPPNDFGLHEMLGNVAEWVADCWTENNLGAPADGSPRLEESAWWSDGECTQPVKRGGSWSTYAWAVRAASRDRHIPGPWRERTYHNGFRVARDLAPIERREFATAQAHRLGEVRSIERRFSWGRSRPADNKRLAPPLASRASENPPRPF